MKKFFEKVPKKPFIFTIILLVLLIGTEIVLANAESSYWVEMENARAYPNSYDVCFLGPSTAMINNSNQELFEQYGIAGISLAEPLQPIYMARCALEEFLEYQSPQVVFLDTSPLFYSEETVEKWTRENEISIITKFLDGVKSSSVRWKMFKEAKLYNDNIKFWNYWLRLEYTHKNWKNMGNPGLKQQYRAHIVHGNDYLIGALEDTFEYVYDTSDPNVGSPINEGAEKYLSEMVELCDEAGADLILLTEKVRFTKAEHDALARLADKYDIKYIDINEHIEEIGFVFNRDLSDPTHFNLSGAIKCSDWLGKYLLEHYEITDKRTVPGYARYEEHSAVFNEKKEYVQGTPFYEYLTELAKLDTEENVIFISVYDEATNRLTDTNIEKLRAFGLNTDLRGQYRCSYAAVIYNSEVQEKFALEDTVTIAGNIGDLSYMVMSGGFSSGNEAHIVVDNVDYIQRGRGFNFVVYNIKSGQVTDSVSFDTYTHGNPYQKREKTEFEDWLEAGTFRGFLAELAELDTKEYAIFLSAYDEATSGLDSIDISLLRALGLEMDLRGQYRCSYAAVIYDSAVQEKFALEDTVTITGKIGDLPYTVMSGGLSSGGEAYIVVDGVDYIQKGRGLNFVIYNTKTGRVTDSVSFDTYTYGNPHQERKRTEFEEVLGTGTFRSFLTELAELDTEEHAVFLSTYDEATSALNGIDIMLLRALGLKTDLIGQYRCSYAAVLHGSEVLERFALDDTVTIEGNIGSLPYRVTSGGLTSGGNASIKLDGTDYIQKGRGFNFVIYNLKTGQVEQSVYFDTYANTNPFMEMITATG